MLDRGWLQHEKDALADGGVQFPGSFGDYEILQEVARGGMGVVYKARQRSLNRVVAVKMILAGRLARQSELDRFKAEAETAARLQHPNIVAIHEVGEFEGQPFFSMDYVEGKNLAQLAHNEPLPAKRAAAYLKTIAEAVQYAHSKGVLHRDLKPSNILIDQNDQPRITDFGLAKRLDDSELSTFNPQLTLTGQVLGSPNFMPPEQAMGERKQVGPSSDVYSLGAILYQLLTGRAPFLADTLPATLRLVSESEPVAPRLLAPSVPRDLETICLKCLQKEPRRRYHTAQELADELDRFLSDDPIRARPIGRAEKFHRWMRRHPIIAALSGVIGLLLVAITLLSTIAAARLHRANQEGQEKLREAYLSQARASRRSGRPGRRFDSLEALRKAAEIRPGLDLRNEAIAAMALIDVRSVKHWSLDIPRAEYQLFDSRLERYVRTYTNGALSLHHTSDDRELVRWPANGLTPHPAGTALSSDGRFLAAAWSSNKLSVLRVEDLFGGKTVLSEARPIRSFKFSRDSRKMITVSGYPKPFIVTIYSTDDWHQIASFTTQSLPYGLEFDPSGSRLAIASPDSWRIQIRSTRSGELIDTLNHPNGIRGLAWSPLGNVIAAGCVDRFLYLWDLSQSPPQATRIQNDAEVARASFNYRGDWLVTSDWHNWSKIWDITTGKELFRWPATNGVDWMRQRKE
jgi:tRNA A-37 threonylcarbamoyl transferase component Bud32